MTRIQEIVRRHKDWPKRVENDLTIMGDDFMATLRKSTYWSSVNEMQKVRGRDAKLDLGQWRYLFAMVLLNVKHEKLRGGE